MSTASPPTRTLEGYLADGIETVDGWLADEAIPILRVLADALCARGVEGGVGEIGVHHGRLFILLALLPGVGDGAVAVDLFERQERNRDQSGFGDRATFTANLARFVPRPERVGVIGADSTELAPEAILRAAGGPLRLVSVDGGHTEEVAENDLALAASVLAPGGIVLLDDYFNPCFPGVAVGGTRYLIDPSGPPLVPFATGGAKLWLTDTPEHAAAYRRALVAADVGSFIATRAHRMAGHEVLCVRFENPSLDGVTWSMVEETVAARARMLGVSPSEYMAEAARRLPPEYLDRLRRIRRAAG